MVDRLLEAVNLDLDEPRDRGARSGSELGNGRECRHGMSAGRGLLKVLPNDPVDLLEKGSGQ